VESVDEQGIHLWNAQAGMDYPVEVHEPLAAEINTWLEENPPAEWDGTYQVRIWFGGEQPWEHGDINLDVLAGDAGIGAWDGYWSL
jgi:hypothetical protein